MSPKMEASAPLEEWNGETAHVMGMNMPISLLQCGFPTARGRETKTAFSVRSQTVLPPSRLLFQRANGTTGP